MIVEPSVLIWVGSGLVLVMLLMLLFRGAAGSGSRVRIRSLSGSVLISRDIYGNVEQNSSAPMRSESKGSENDRGTGVHGDRIAWGIGIIGVLVAGVGVYLDHFAGRG